MFKFRIVLKLLPQFKKPKTNSADKFCQNQLFPKFKKIYIYNIGRTELTQNFNTPKTSQSKIFNHNSLKILKFHTSPK